MDHDGVFINGLLLETPGAPSGAVAFDRQQIFCAPWQPVQRATIFSGSEVAVGFSGLGLGTIISEGDVEFEQWVVPLEAREVHLCQSDGGNFLGSNQLPQPTRRKESYVIEILGNIAFPHSGRSGDAQRALLPLVFHARQDGVEDKRGRDAVGDVQLKDLFVAFDLVVKAVEHHLLVLVGNGHVGDQSGFVNHLLSDFFFLLGQGPQHSGKQGGGNAKRRADSEKSATIEHRTHASCAYVRREL